MPITNLMIKKVNFIINTDLEKLWWYYGSIPLLSFTLYITDFYNQKHNSLSYYFRIKHECTWFYQAIDNNDHLDIYNKILRVGQYFVPPG